MTGLGRAMVGGGLNDRARPREKDDFYPTPPEPVLAFLNYESQAIRAISDHVWEPCCGDGAISRLLEHRGYRVTSTDLKPRGTGAALDFLQGTTCLAPVIVTNPPYIGNLPEKMLVHAFDLGVQYIAFLLKANYWNTGRGYRLWQRFRPERELKVTWRVDFLGLKKPTMDVNWYVWQARSTLPLRYGLPRTDLLRRPNMTPAQQALFGDL